MGLALEESVDESSEIVEKVDGVQFVFEERIKPHVEGKVLDYYQDATNEGFTINNEAPGSDCGGGCCG